MNLSIHIGLDLMSMALISRVLSAFVQNVLESNYRMCKGLVNLLAGILKIGTESPGIEQSNLKPDHNNEYTK